MKKKWEKLRYNEVLNSKNEDFYISFNHLPFGADSSETALYKDGKYYILDGDFRSEYESLIDQEFEKCLEFFHSNSEFKSTWSTDNENDISTSLNMLGNLLKDLSKETK